MKIFDHISEMFKSELRLLVSLHTNDIIRWTSRCTIFLILGGFAYLMYSWNKLPTEIPLWYSKPWGNDRLAAPIWLLILPGMSFFWYVVNSFLSLHITKEHLVFSQILYLSSLLVSAFSFCTLVMIIWIIS